MKKLIIICLILLLAGCATTQKSTYIVPQHIQERPAKAAYAKAVLCMGFATDEVAQYLFIRQDQEANASAEGDTIYLTEGLFNLDDAAITFVICHELAHIKLKHLRNKRAVSIATTGFFVAAGFFIPGIGLLNHVANPAVVSQYSKPQELEADKLASETLVKCFDIPIDKQVQILQSMKPYAGRGGGFWDQHPSWEDRIKNVQLK